MASSGRAASNFSSARCSGVSRLEGPFFIGSPFVCGGLAGADDAADPPAFLRFFRPCMEGRRRKPVPGFNIISDAANEECPFSSAASRHFADRLPYRATPARPLRRRWVGGTLFDPTPTPVLPVQHLAQDTGELRLAVWLDQEAEIGRRTVAAVAVELGFGEA